MCEVKVDRLSYDQRMLNNEWLIDIQNTSSTKAEWLVDE